MHTQPGEAAAKAAPRANAPQYPATAGVAVDRGDYHPLEGQ